MKIIQKGIKAPSNGVLLTNKEFEEYQEYKNITPKLIEFFKETKKQNEKLKHMTPWQKTRIVHQIKTGESNMNCTNNPKLWKQLKKSILHVYVTVHKR